ncbi:hypothetical protein [Paraburkholderia sp. JHI869]|uniref:hypothetical protein n=1 Tax=Paraburkholderia sp. JHI869 TaxID=3112959 RepID=UPI003173CC65
MNAVDVVVEVGMGGTDAVIDGLRALIEKWLGVECPVHLRVAEGARTGARQKRFVRIEVPSRRDRAAMYFFLHDDGNWSVLPQEENRLAMSPRLYAA